MSAVPAYTEGSDWAATFTFKMTYSGGGSQEASVLASQVSSWASECPHDMAGGFPWSMCSRQRAKENLFKV